MLQNPSGTSIAYRIAMLTKFLLASLRAMKKNRLYAAVNVLNLSIGIASFSLMWLWLDSQLSFDQWHSKGTRIFQIGARVAEMNSTSDYAVTPPALAIQLAQTVPGVVNVLRLDKCDAAVNVPAGNFKQDGIFAADTSFFSFFDFVLLQGDTRTALANPYSVVLTRSLAFKYFGTEDVLDKSIRIFQYDPSGHGADFKVTGVIEDCPPNCHFAYQLLISFSTVITAEPQLLQEAAWEEREYYTYVLLDDAVSYASIDQTLKRVSKTFPSPKNGSVHYFATPLSEIHFNTSLQDPASPPVSMSYLFSFLAIGFVVLIFACLNYINMSTAFALDRAREVGVRRALGSSSWQVGLHTVLESWLIAMIAMVLAFAILELCHPLLTSILGWSLGNLLDLNVVATLFSISTICGIAAGVYPALIVSGYQPSKVLKGVVPSGTTGLWFRKTLVSVQFSLTVLMLIAVVSLTLQMRFVKQRDLGFATEGLIIISMNGSPEAGPGFSQFQSALASAKAVSNVARSNTMIGQGLDKETAIAPVPALGQVQLSSAVAGVDAEYLTTYSIDLVAGRNFQPGDTVDMDAFLVNEEAVRGLGYQNYEDALGQPYMLGKKQGKIIGIVKNFHHATLHKAIEPVTLFKLGSYYSRISVKISGSPSDALDEINTAFKTAFPSTVFDYSFAEKRVEALYASETRMEKTFSLLSVIALTMAVLGLVAVISFAIRKRMKEIAVRRIVGAGTRDLTKLFAREFVLLIAISCAVAAPVGKLLIDQWLSQFAFHIDGTGAIVVLSTIASFSIAMFIIVVKVSRVGGSSVVEVLR